ncbi:TonB family protein [Anaeromyxobacter sp. K]|uniref:TonB-dependent receptor domain-containing protein n=1 Tax=Anaeromyxobacter sp. (strain K) TaxID=447217 RepID=UPI00017BE2FF|nr:TonB-dependent receptor [Anaeromyxobacter sp. K]ACG72738.1 TonB family protein [Anaeromyxobacter sp. K]
MIRLLTLAAALLAAAPPLARAGEGVGALTRAPELLEAVEPDYPEAARAAGVTGVVALELELSDAGEVVSAEVTGSADHGLDEAALAAARRLRFTPAEIDGKPAAVRIAYRFEFRLAAPEDAPAPPELRGRVLERGTRLPVAGALVRAEPAAGEGRSTYTDRDGRFALAGVPAGPVAVTVEDGAHRPLRSMEEVRAGEALEATYWVARAAGPGEYEAVVVGEREAREVSRVALSAGEVRRVPGASGDAVKVLQNLPGVARPPGPSGQLVVRGGNPRDTRVYVDGQRVPQVFHFGGLTSVYASDLLQDVEFEPGNFGVRTGRAIGGRVNLVTRDPGEHSHALADVNLYHATALVEGTTAAGVGVALAARRSYADAILTRAAEQSDDGPGMRVAPRYYDLQAKAAWHPGPDDTVRLDVFGSDDRMVLTGVAREELRDVALLEYGTRFSVATLRWAHRASEATRVEVSAGGDWQDATIRAGDAYQERSRVFTGSVRSEVRHAAAPWLDLAAGVDGGWAPSARVEVTAPPFPPPGQVPSPQEPPRRYRARIEGAEGGAFLEATWKPAAGVAIVPGIRADAQRLLGTRTWADPRVAARWQLRASTALTAAAGLYHQSPPLAYLTEEWGNPALRPEGAWQYSAGVEQRLLPRLTVGVQLFAKRLFDLALPSDATVVRDGVEVPERFSSRGTGRARGAELLLRWEPGARFTGWLATSWSRTRRGQAVGGERLEDEGDAYDQPLNLVAVGSWELPELWDGLSAGFRLRAGSGNPYEPVRAAVYDADADAYRPLETGRRSARMPAFFQLDVRADKKWTYRTWTFAAYLEIQNATARENAEAVAWNHDYTRRGWVTGLPFFPAFGLRAEY